jgi:hypothetical protein
MHLEPTKVFCWAFASVLLAGCTHRSVAGIEGQVVVPEAVTEVLLQLEDGSLKLLAPGALDRSGTTAPSASGERVIRWRGGIRRGAGSEQELRQLEGVPVEVASEVREGEPHRLVLQAPQRPAGMAPDSILGVEMVMELPVDLVLDVRIRGSGHVTVEDRQADIRVDTGRGDLKVSRCRGSLRMQTGTGMTIVYEHCGDVDVRAMVGDMQAFIREPADTIRLVTGQGNVQCLVPPTAGFRVDARTETGKVANGFGIPNERDGYSSRILGERGDARTEILLRSSSGHLSLSHKSWE